ncbi:MAG: glycoside hydrolase family 2 protein, partial [Lachnospiraceae bacterium]|nr:glycoside hydrolase family 2 protein [Lachnospiraceae bacterium]
MIQGNFDRAGLEKVRLPHTTAELPFHYFDEHEYQMLCGYVRHIYGEKEWAGKTVLLTFEAVGHDAAVYLNGTKICENHCGYTAFTADLTEHIKLGEDNLLVVRVDSREDLNIPPFGFVIDYMTYGGIYRDVYLTINNPAYIRDVFVTTRLADRYYEDLGEEKPFLRAHASKTLSRIEITGAGTDFVLRQSIRKKGE